MTASPQTCKECGGPLLEDISGDVCPVCLARACLGDAAPGLEPEAPVDAAWLARFGLDAGNEAGGPVMSFGDYELIEEIARGGMGIVYKARQKSLGRLVAVKMILAGQFAGPQIAQRFRGEAAAAGTLHHPHIVAIHEIGLHGGQHFFSMDYVQGQNLAQLVGVRPLPPCKAAQYVRQIAEAIHYAHEQGILHRDLKPSNVLIDAATDEARVTDFGLARRLDSHSTITYTGQILGSPNFMPPEQAGTRRGHVGRRSDVYGLGAILYYTLTARPPFQGASIAATLHEVLQTEPLAPRALNPGVPRDLETICLKCLEKDPSKRYASAQDLADELGRFLRDEPIRARPVTRFERIWRWCRRNPALASLSAATALGVIAIAVVSTVAAVRLEISHRKMQLENYAALITEANRLLLEGESDRAIQLLTNCPRKLRHWEWGRLMFACHQAILTIPAHTNIHRLKDQVWPLVPAIAFNPEGTHLVTLGADGTARVWLTSDGRNVLTFGGATNRVLCVAFHPKASQLALGLTNGLVRFWSTMSWRELAPWPAGKGALGRSLSAGTAPAIVHLAYSPNGHKLAVASSDHTVQVLDASANTQLFDTNPAPGPIHQLMFTRDGARLLARIRHATATGTHVLALRIWDAQSGQQLAARDWNPDEYQTLFMDPDGNRFITIDKLDQIRLWSNLSDYQDLGITSGGQLGSHRYASYSGDGRHLCVSGEENMAKIVDTLTGRPVMHLPGRIHRSWFSPDGTKLATVGTDRLLRIWDVTNRKELLTLRGHLSIVQNAAFSPDGRLIASVASDGVVKLWNAGPGRELIQGSCWPWGTAFSPDGRRVAMGSWFDDLVIWDVRTGQEAVRLKTKNPLYTMAVFSPDARRIILAGRKSPRIFDAETGRQLGELRGHTRLTWAIAHSADGRTIATGSFDHTARLWDARTGRELHTLSGHPQWVMDVAFDPAGRKVVTASGTWAMSNYDPARVWDVESGRLLFTVGGPGSGVTRVKFTPDGQSLVGLCEDKKLRIWNAATGRVLRAWNVRAVGVGGLGLSPDGKRLAAPMADIGAAGTDVPVTELWDAEHGRQLLGLKGHEDTTYDPLFSPDGRTLITVSTDFTGRLWETFPWREDEYPQGPAGSDLAQRIELYARNYWRERINAERTPSEDNQTRASFARTDAAADNPFDWPARDTNAPPELIDLTPHYNAFLDIIPHPTGGWDFDNNFEDLPQGLVTFENIRFDVRGIITLRPREASEKPSRWMWEKYPVRRNDIRIGRKLRRLHVLHGTCFQLEQAGTVVGSYVWHYADGSQREFEIVYGRDLRDWLKSREEEGGDTDRAKVAWTGSNPELRENNPTTTLRLYLRTYENPQPEIEVSRIDFVSHRSKAAPFLVAMTAEP